MRFGLSDDTINKINSVLSKHPEVIKVIIFGSRAKGNYREGSDIDITLFGDEISEKNKSLIITEIDELNTPYLFDISIFNSLDSPDLIDHILRVGQVFYEKVPISPTSHPAK